MRKKHSVPEKRACSARLVGEHFDKLRARFRRVLFVQDDFKAPALFKLQKNFGHCFVSFAFDRPHQ